MMATGRLSDLEMTLDIASEKSSSSARDCHNQLDIFCAQLQIALRGVHDFPGADVGITLEKLRKTRVKFEDLRNKLNETIGSLERLECFIQRAADVQKRDHVGRECAVDSGFDSSLLHSQGPQTSSTLSSLSLSSSYFEQSTTIVTQERGELLDTTEYATNSAQIALGEEIMDDTQA